MERIQEISSTVEINSIEFEMFVLITNASLEFSPSFFPHLGRSRMIPTRAKSHRRNKVTVRWLPVELIIEIFRAVQKLIGRAEFSQRVYTSMKLDREYTKNLLAFASSSKEWTAIAQAELFRTVTLKDRSKMGRFLEAVRGSEKLNGFCRAITSLNMGGQHGGLETEGLGYDLDEIALYCPNIVEVSCYEVKVRLEYFRKSSWIHLVRSSMLTIISTGRKHEEFGQAQPLMWICPPAFHFWSTNPAPHSSYHSAITQLRHHLISP
jgi:hypothetical protein